MQTESHIRDILIGLAQAQVRFVVCGGVALVLHGLERSTLDLDVAVDLSESNLKKLLPALRELKLRPRAPVPAEIIIDPGSRQRLIDEKNAVVFTFMDFDQPFRQLDIFLAEPPPFEELEKRAERIMVDGAQILVASKKDLIAMKRAMPQLRDKDRFDIAALTALMGESK